MAEKTVKPGSIRIVARGFLDDAADAITMVKKYDKNNIPLNFRISDVFDGFLVCTPKAGYFASVKHMGFNPEENGSIYLCEIYRCKKCPYAEETEHSKFIKGVAENLVKSFPYEPVQAFS
jgi:hypothetical protein